MKNGATYFKWSIILICFVSGVFMFRGCKCNKERIKEVPIVKVRVDTFWKKQDTFISYIPKPYKVLVPTNVEIQILSDSLVLASAIKDGIISHQLDSLEILRDYLTKRYYADSFKIEYGKIYSYDTVAFNQLLGKGIKADITVSEITKTYTIEAKQRTTLYIGGDMYGNANSPIYAVGGAIGLRFRNGKYYEAKALLSKEGIPFYGAGFRLPIRLHKK